MWLFFFFTCCKYLYGNAWIAVSVDYAVGESWAGEDGGEV